METGGGSFLETGDRGEPYPLGPPPPHHLGGGRGGFATLDQSQRRRGGGGGGGNQPRRFLRERGGLQQTGPPGGTGRQRSPLQSSVQPALRTGPEASGGSRRKAFPRKRSPHPVRGELSEKQVAGAIKTTAIEEPQRPWESKRDDSNRAVKPEAADDEGATKPEAEVEGDGAITSGLIVGLCKDVPKGYFRLTGPPDPVKIRPKPVLVDALKFVQDSSKDYNFKADQLKSIRQDMTVQNIEDELSVQVYEFHARLALCNRDMAELNLCLTKLHCLYGNKRNGGHHGEFAAYDILLSAIQDKNTELMSKLGRLSSDLKQQEAVKHAKEVAHSIQTGNYASFFKLYKVAPNLNGYLMGICFEKMRFEGLKCMAKAYATKIPVKYMSKILGFAAIDETVDWLKSHGAVLSSFENGEMALLPKESIPLISMPVVPADDIRAFKAR